MDCIQEFSGKLLGKDPLGRPRRKYENNIRLLIREFATCGSEPCHLSRTLAMSAVLIVEICLQT
jgi:hypothetical protein